MSWWHNISKRREYSRLLPQYRRCCSRLPAASDALPGAPASCWRRPPARYLRQPAEWGVRADYFRWKSLFINRFQGVPECLFVLQMQCLLTFAFAHVTPSGRGSVLFIHCCRIKFYFFRLLLCECNFQNKIPLSTRSSLELRNPQWGYEFYLQWSFSWFFSFVFGFCFLTQRL